MEKLLKRVPGMQGRRRSIMQLAVLALVLPASKVAAQADVDEHMPVTLTATSPCTGELFMGSGFIMSWKICHAAVSFSRGNSRRRAMSPWGDPYHRLSVPQTTRLGPT